ncbi:MAG: MotA/TolQ/ExbB proton channel family protein [Hellea sp.]
MMRYLIIIPAAVVLSGCSPTNVASGLQEFMDVGGWVLYPIAFFTFFMWTFIIERFAYYSMAHKSLKTRLKNEWDARTDKSSWRAHAIRDEMISQVKGKTGGFSVAAIKTLVALMPLLGLLGTVTGMINVFDAMALSGSSNARLMAGGVFQATIPTMAGMVAALSGLFFSNSLPRWSIRETARFADELQLG